MAVVHTDDTGEDEGGTEPEVAMAIGEIAGKLDTLLAKESEPAPQCDHGEILARVSELEGKVDILVAWVEELGKTELEEEAHEEPVQDLTIVAPEPEPEPPEHAFFRKIGGE